MPTQTRSKAPTSVERPGKATLPAPKKASEGRTSPATGTQPEKTLPPAKPKGRGRPRKQPALDGLLGDEHPDKVPTAVPAHRKQGQDATASDAEKEKNMNPPKKRARAAVAGGAAQESNAPIHAVKTVQRRGGVPDRRNGDKKKPTKAELAQAKRIQEIEDKIREGERAKELLAEMNFAEEKEAQTMHIDNPQRLSTVVQKQTRKLLSDSSDDGESFDFSPVEKVNEVDSDEEPAKMKAIRKTKKVAKGELRGDVEARVAKLCGNVNGTKESNKKAKLANFEPVDTAPKRYENSGLKTQSLVKSKKMKGTETIDPFESGGLHDNDTEDIRPGGPRQTGQRLANPHFPKNLERDQQRQNEFVNLAESSEEEEETRVQRGSGKSSKSQGQLVGKKKTSQKCTSNPAHADAAEFLKDDHWGSVFLPSLSHALYLSCDPFLEFTSESPVFLETVQECFDLAFSNVEYILTPGNPVVTTAYERVKHKKSKLAREILAMIKKDFEAAEFTGQHTKIRAHAIWALRPDGPAYYQIPTPQDCRLRDGQPGYIAPDTDTFLKTKVIIKFVDLFLGYATNSALQPPIGEKHPPIGLYILILLSVEWAFTAHLKGHFKVPAKFSHKACCHALVTFRNHLDSLSERRWSIILNTQIDDDTPLDLEEQNADESMVSEYRAHLYIPRSPRKAA